MRRTQRMFITLAMAWLVLMLSASGCKKIKPDDPTKKVTTATPKDGNQQGSNLQAPKISLTASPTAINSGDPTTLSWESSNATSVTVDSGIGTVEASGSRTISPRVSTTYKATATGQIGNPATAEVRVTVTPPKPVVDQPIPPDKFDTPDPIWMKTNIRDVFFDYDQYSIRDDARATLLSNVRALAERPKIRLTIAGYCDEGGSEKYNLALGDRRANAVKDFLTAQGVDGNRIDTISYGKEQNFCEEHNEECWQLNRRAQFAAR
jgi:peptidoglycan-associated lipoprotein